MCLPISLAGFPQPDADEAAIEVGDGESGFSSPVGSIGFGEPDRRDPAASDVGPEVRERSKRCSTPSMERPFGRKPQPPGGVIGKDWGQWEAQR